jgi:AcrR family transcriptional regulator
MTHRLDDMLDAAARVIARDGADALRMSDVAREAGVSTGLVHYYVSTRDELLALVFARTDATSDALAVEATRGLETGAERLEAMLTIYLEDSSAFDQTWVVSIEVWRAAMFNPKLRAPAQESYQLWLDLLGAELDAGKADGSIPADVVTDDAARTLAATLDGLAQQVVIGSLGHERATALLRAGIGTTLAGSRRLDRVAG